MTTTDPKTEWCRNYANVLRLAHHLTDTAEISTVSALLDYFSAPWKWTPEWEAMLVAGRCDLCNRPGTEDNPVARAPSSAGETFAHVECPRGN